jgi:hypothetical protein
MRRAIASFAFVVCACANGHHAGTGADSATIDSPVATIDSPQGTIDSPEGTIDSPQGTIDSPVAAIDSPVATIDSPVATIDSPIVMIDAKPVDAKPIDAMSIDGAPDANNCTTQPCTLAPECGCDTSMEETCDIDRTTLSSNICRHVNTPGRETSTCAAVGDCDIQYTCLGDGACHKFCASNGDCGSPRGQCVIQVVDNNNKAIPGAVICSSNCDPLTSAASYCPPNDKCGIFTATFNGTDHDITDCEAAGAGGQDSSCLIAGSSPPNGDDTKCAAGQMCTTLNNTTFNCRQICKYPTGACPIGTSCIGFSTPLTIAGVTYGVCA